MLFNSIEFLIFLPVVFLLYWFVLSRDNRLQNFFIVVVSYIFYGWWDWRFLILIAFTSGCSYLSGLLIERYDKQQRARWWINTVNITINLAILGIFKYYNFFIASFASAFDINNSSLLLNVILPVGVSFYTFQALSYSIDVYKRVLKPTHSALNLFAYISFFPQLVAGPIERATNLLPQFEKKRKFDYALAVDGSRQMLWGFFKKVAIADICAENVSAIFDNYQTADTSVLILGAILFSIQIYGDFSGYSDIAIGCSKLFGIRLMQNFNLPYFSRDIAEFWRRWHISLTTWFRDYLYIPMGGSRGSTLISIRNTFIIFIVSGLWHGANWTYVLWGVYHAILFVPLLLMKKNRKHRNTIAENKMLPSLGEFMAMGSTFVMVAIGWVIFRAPSISVALDYLSRIVTGSWGSEVQTDLLSTTDLRILAITLPLLIVFEWLARGKKHPLEIMTSSNIFRYKIIRWLVYYALAFFVLTNARELNTFIYFQF